MFRYLKLKTPLLISLALALSGCQAVEGYSNKLVSVFTGLLTSLTNAIRFPSFR